MPIKVSWKGLDEEIRDSIELLRKNVLGELAAIGEEANSIARNGHLYTDQTGNLSSSIGFAVLDRGRIVTMSHFEVVGDGEEGSEIGNSLISEIAGRISADYALVLVAGMEYASYVEAMGLNVLEGAQLYCFGKVPERVKNATERAIRRLNSRIKQASK